MTIPFWKYHGTGNDFILIDQRVDTYLKEDDIEQISFICDRRFGIGADGLIILRNHPDYDFEMLYFNSDGNPSSMCGNGGRCIVSFAKKLGIIQGETRFLAVDGPHQATIDEQGWVSLKMSDVDKLTIAENHFELDTGSPHFVTFVEDADDINVERNGKAIRYSDRYKEEGINVNFVEKTDEGIIVLTYERGVEGETFSCGTGVTASAIAYAHDNGIENKMVDIKTRGGELQVRFLNTKNGFSNIWLSGPTTFVFQGQLNLDAKKAIPEKNKRISEA